MSYEKFKEIWSAHGFDLEISIELKFALIKAGYDNFSEFEKIKTLLK